MGRQQTYELLEDFIRETKNNNVKTIFFNLANIRDEVNPNHMVARISVSALSKDGKEYFAHSKNVSEIIFTDKTTKEETDAFIAKGKAEIDSLLVTFQDKFASADMIAGFCSPNGA